MALSINGKEKTFYTKKNIMKNLLFLLLLLGCLSATAQNNAIENINAKMKEAKQFLKGNLKPYNPAKALELFKECAAKGNAEAMNAIGMQYRLGLGADIDLQSAFKWYHKAAIAGYSKAWYNLGMMYKYGEGIDQNLSKSYECFKTAADMGDHSGWYAQGYMLYKGLGCIQDYSKAYTLFRKGTEVFRASCMYFTGLCFRNGYGVKANADSAMYWLSLAAKIGYRFAKDELATNEPENSIDATALLEKITAIQSKIAPGVPHNKYRKIEQRIKASDIEGIYSGYLIQYDWSGRNIIKAKTLNLSLTYKDGLIKGLWVEDDTLSVSLEGNLTSQAILFSNTQYKRTDHYSPEKPVTFNFEEAKLLQIKKDDSLFLAGNVNLFSPDRKEPEKPFYTVLKRVAKGSDDSTKIELVSNINNQLRVFPNPFSNTLIVEFEIKQICQVFTQLLTMDGKLIYSNPAKQLSPGQYSLPIQVNISAGTYLVKLHSGKEVKTAMVVKQ
jgi:TPR repeat protein